MGVEVRVGREQPGGEAAVTIAEEQGLAARGERGEVMEAGAFEPATEGEVLEPAVEGRDAVEVGGLLHLESKAQNRSGVSRARSAEARRVVGAR